MCIWNISEEERRCEYCSYRGGCESYEKQTPVWEASAIYVGIMSGLLGRNVMERSREHMLVWARYMICYKLLMSGYSQPKVGKELNLNHATVCHGKKQVETMLKYPGMYPEETCLWEKFTSLLA